MVSLLIVDDHPVYRDALHQYLSRKFSSHHLEVFSSGNISDGIKLIETANNFWVVLLDLSVPDSKDCLSGIRQFKEIEDVVAIAAISGMDEQLWASQYINEGCQVFISKNNDVEYIYRQIHLLMSAYLQEPIKHQLTARQLEIMKYLADGDANKMIAYRLGIKEQTVKIHIGAIFKELKVTNRTQAINRAKQLNLI